MMIDIRPVIINGWVALRLLFAGFFIENKKGIYHKHAQSLPIRIN